MINIRRQIRSLVIVLICGLLFSGIAFAQNDTPQVILTSPTIQEVFEPGDKVIIEGNAQNLPQVTISIRNSKGGLIYTAQPVVAAGCFITDFTLAADALEGEYTVKIGGMDLPELFTGRFQVQKAAMIGLTQPREDERFEPGDKVEINGTAEKASEVTISVRNSNGGLVYTAQPKVEQGKFSTTFILSKEAVIGEYTICIGAEGLEKLCTHSFQVKKETHNSGGGDGNSSEPKPDIPVITPPLPPNNKEFGDLVNHWAKKDIETLVAKGIVKGVSETEFAPEAPITRAQFAALLVRALGLEAGNAGTVNFKDVPAGAWYKNEVAIALNAGLINGYSTELFGPNDYISREQMAVMMARATVMQQLGEVPGEENIRQGLQRFDDHSNISEWAQSGMALAIEQGLVNGMTEQQLVPQANATRAQGAVMILRLYNRL